MIPSAFVKAAALVVLTVLFLPSTPACAAVSSTIKMATTTSTENSGLLGWLLPVFKEQTGITVQAIATGSGKAIKLGENGDVDVLMVHSRESELEFVARGYGIDRREFMYNDFVVVGPAADPAGIAGMKDAAGVFSRISASQVAFISRGDESGTHKKELELWGKATVKPEGTWYLSAGQGMEAVLIMASEKLAYTITDRGTWIAVEEKVELKILFSGDSALFNQYGVIAVNPEKFPKVNYAGAKKFIEWITSKKGQKLITEFKIRGQQLFYSNAVVPKKQ